MPRLVYWSGVALMLVAGAFLLTDALLWRPGITEANARRLRPGMALEEVKAILGEAGVGVDFTGHPARRQPLIPRLWSGRGGAVWVYVNDEGRAASVHWSPRTP